MINSLFVQIGGLFAITASIIGFINGGSSALIANVICLFFLFVIVLFLVSRSLKQQVQLNEQYQKQLADVQEALNATTKNLEERVERRTFEISVANASLNREIAERIQAEQETKQIKRRMELILESAGEGIFGLDANGNVTFVNKAASQAVGFMPEELIGKSHHDLVHHTHVDGSKYFEDECPIHQAYRDGKVHRGSNEFFWSKDGQGIAVEYVSTPIIENDAPSGAVVVFKTLQTTTKGNKNAE